MRCLKLCAASGKGGQINLRAIPNAAPGMTPLQIWCNEAQERFVLAVAKKDAELFAQIARSGALSLCRGR